jgi:hypothetical protein
MMNYGIIEVEAIQRFPSIAINAADSGSINRAFDELATELTIIADLATFRRKPDSGKGAGWWGPKVHGALADAKLERKAYIAASSEEAWTRYQSKLRKVRQTINAAKDSSWRRALAAAIYNEKGLWKLEKWARLRSWAPPEDAAMPPLRWSETDDTLEKTHQGKAELLGPEILPESGYRFNRLK